MQALADAAALAKYNNKLEADLKGEATRANKKTEKFAVEQEASKRSWFRAREQLKFRNRVPEIAEIQDAARQNAVVATRQPQKQVASTTEQ